MSTGVRVVYLFDLDGTLLRCGGAGRRAFDRALASTFALDRGSAGVVFAGRTDPALLDEILQARRGQAASADERAAFYQAYLPCLEDELTRSADFAVVAGAEATLSALAARGDARLGVATGNIAAGAHAKLVRAGLAGWFGFGGYGDDGAIRAELVARAIERSGGGDAVVVVGDTAHDVEAARAVGARAVGVTAGGGARAELTGADVILDELPALLAWHEAQFAPALG